jgi:hypothetical protein
VAVSMEAARQLSPVRGGIVHLAELPVAASRSTAYELIRSLSPVGSRGYLVTPLVLSLGAGPA